MKTGAGRILGRVLASDNGAPLRRAQVRLTAPEVGVRTALTDADGASSSAICRQGGFR